MMLDKTELEKFNFNFKKPCLFSYPFNFLEELDINEIKDIMDEFIENNKLPMVIIDDDGDVDIEMQDSYYTCKKDFLSFLSKFIEKYQTNIIKDEKFLINLCHLLYIDKNFDREIFNLYIDIIDYSEVSDNYKKIINNIINNCSNNEKFIKRFKTFLNEILDEKNFNISKDYVWVETYINLFGDKLTKTEIKKILTKIINSIHSLFNMDSEFKLEYVDPFKRFVNILDLIEKKTKYDICSLGFKKTAYVNMIVLIALYADRKDLLKSCLFEKNKWKEFMSPDFVFAIVRLFFKRNLLETDKLEFISFLMKLYVIDELVLDSLDEEEKNDLIKIIRYLLKKDYLDCNSVKLQKFFEKIKEEIGYDFSKNECNEYDFLEVFEI